LTLQNSVTNGFEKGFSKLDQSLKRQAYPSNSTLLLVIPLNSMLVPMFPWMVFVIMNYSLTRSYGMHVEIFDFFPIISFEVQMETSETLLAFPSMFQQKK
jgi:hypothetical protein